MIEGVVEQRPVPLLTMPSFELKCKKKHPIEEYVTLVLQKI